MQSNASAAGGGNVVKILLLGLGIVGLYFLYKWVTNPGDLEATTILNTIQAANPTSAYITDSKGLPALIEGGEYTINTWIYINDWAVNRGRFKPVLVLGGRGFKTLAVYMGAYRNSIHIRVDTRTDRNKPLTSDSTESDLTTKTLEQTLQSAQMDTDILNTVQPCDIPQIDLQKWVQLTVVLNNKTCDVYLDGKLARSCLLPSFYKVDRTNIQLDMGSFGGFGGYLGNTTAFNYAVNPDQVWKLYMEGPGQKLTFWQYLTGLFNPSGPTPFDYPKKSLIA